MNRYFGTNNHTIKIAVCIIFRSVTLFLENKQSYTQSQSCINTLCFCCHGALHSRWDLTFKARSEMKQLIDLKYM